MIRHHEAQDLFSAEAAPMYFWAGMPEKTYRVLLPGAATVQPSANAADRAPTLHPFAVDAAALSAPILLAVLVTTLFMLFKVHKEAAQLRRIRDQYRNFVRVFTTKNIVPPRLSGG
jgi:hypothetical protein